MTQPVDPRARVERRLGRVLVTGATGMLGRAVCARLHRPRALVRVSSDRSSLEGTGAWMVEGDLLRPDTLAPALDGVELVLHLAGRPQPRRKAEAVGLATRGTANLLAAWRGPVVAVSCDAVLREPRCSFGEALATHESQLLEAGAVVLRPGLTLGPGSQALATLRRMSRWPAAPFAVDVQRRAPLWVGDVAEAVIAATSLEGPLLLDLPGREPCGPDVLVRMVAVSEGRRPLSGFPIPRRLMPHLFWLTRLVGIPFDAERLQGLRQEVRTDPGPAQRAIGWDPLPTSEVFRRCAQELA